MNLNLKRNRHNRTNTKVSLKWKNKDLNTVDDRFKYNKQRNNRGVGMLAQGSGLITANLITDSFKRQYGIVGFKSEIKNLKDAHYIIKSSDRQSEARNLEASVKAREFVFNFDEITNKAVRRFQDTGINQELIDSAELIIKNSKETIQKDLTKTYITILESKSTHINPILYFSAKKHYVISKIFFDKMFNFDVKRLRDKIGTKIEIQDNDLEYFALGAFVAFEPIIVPAAFSHMNRNDVEFITKYSALVDKFTYIVANKFPNEYMSASELEKKDFSKRNNN